MIKASQSLGLFWIWPTNNNGVISNISTPGPNNHWGLLATYFQSTTRLQSMNEGQFLQKRPLLLLTIAPLPLGKETWRASKYFELLDLSITWKHHSSPDADRTDNRHPQPRSEKTWLLAWNWRKLCMPELPAHLCRQFSACTVCYVQHLASPNYCMYETGMLWLLTIALAGQSITSFHLSKDRFSANMAHGSLQETQLCFHAHKSFSNSWVKIITLQFPGIQKSKTKI